MFKKLSVPFTLAASAFFFSCQKEATYPSSEYSAAPAGILWQSEIHEDLNQQIQNTVKNNNDGGVTSRTRSFDKAFTFSGVDCSGENVALAGKVNYTTTDVFDQTGNEVSLKTHLIVQGTGKTTDGETFRVHEVSEENFNLAGAKAGGHFLIKERWRTAHHGGTIIFELTGKFNAQTFTYEYHVAAITYKCG